MRCSRMVQHLRACRRSHSAAVDPVICPDLVALRFRKRVVHDVAFVNRLGVDGDVKGSPGYALVNDRLQAEHVQGHSSKFVTLTRWPKYRLAAVLIPRRGAGRGRSRYSVVRFPAAAFSSSMGGISPGTSSGASS